MEEMLKELKRIQKKYPEYVILVFEKDKTIGEIIQELSYK